MDRICDKRIHASRSLLCFSPDTINYAIYVVILLYMRAPSTKNLGCPHYLEIDKSKLIRVLRFRQRLHSLSSKGFLECNVVNKLLWLMETKHWYQEISQKLLM